MKQYKFLMLDSDGNILSRLETTSYTQRGYGRIYGKVETAGKAYVLLCVTHAWAMPIVDAKRKTKLRDMTAVVSIINADRCEVGGSIFLDITKKPNANTDYFKYLKP